MIQFTAVLTFFFIFSASVHSQRFSPASTDFATYRPLGSIRGWTFVAKDSAIGQLISTIKQQVEIDDIDGFEMSQILQFDYTKIGGDRIQRVRSSHYVSTNGSYLGDKMVIDINEETEQLELERNGDYLEGFYTRGDNRIKSKLPLKRDEFAADIFFLDQYENFLAMRDLKVGDTIFDSVFVPQTMLIEPVVGFVEHFGLVTLYNQVRDSVFVIKITQPQVMIFYFSPKKQLVKAEFLAQQMKAYLDIVRQLPSNALVQEKFGFKKFIDLLPNVGVYLIVGLLSLVFVAGSRVRNPHLYFYALIGGLGFLIAIYTQIPLQTYLAEKIYLPKINLGKTAYLWAIVPALPAGLIQELIKLGIILAIRRYAKTERTSLLIFGAAAGAGFGIAEAAYVVSQLPASPIWSINLVERGFFILFHTTTGVLLSAAILMESKKSKVFLISVAVVANGFLRYLPVFAQKSVLSAQLLYILLPIVPVLLLAYCVYLLKTQHVVSRK